MQDMAYAVSSTYLVSCLLLCGFYIRYSDLTLSYYKGLTWTAFSKYTFEGLAINEFQDRKWDLTHCEDSKPGLAPPHLEGFSD